MLFKTAPKLTGNMKALHIAPAHLLLLCLLILWCAPLQSAYFENLSIGHGLSQGSVYAITQDHQGYLWIGTNNGLNRYDGVKFVFFGNVHDNPDSPAALSNNNIYTITADADGNFWIGTHQGLNFFNTRTYQNQRFLHDPNNPNSLGNNTIRETLLDKQGNLWIATYDGLNKYNPRTGVFSRYRNPPDSLCSNILRALMEDKAGMIWTGSNESGLCRFDPETFKFTPVDYRNDPMASASIAIRELHLDQDGTVWIASTQGLFHYNQQNGTSIAYRADPLDPTRLPNEWVQTITAPDQQHLWIGTAGGLGLLNKSSGKFIQFRENKNSSHGLSNEEVLSLFIDRSGLLWVGTNGSGIEKYNPRQTAFHYLGADGRPGYTLSDPAIWEVAKAYGYLWISTTNGLNRYDTHTGKIKTYFPDPNNSNSIVSENIFSITAGSNRDLWLGTQRGLSHFYVDSERFENYQREIDNLNSIPFNNIIASTLDQEGKLWLASFGEGVAILDTKHNKFTHLQHNPNELDSISHNFVYDVYQASDGSIWLGTLNGLDRYEPRSNNFRHYRRPQEPTRAPGNNEIVAMHGARNGNILIGTPIGLSIFDPTNKSFSHYSKKDGLEDEYIYSIEEDGSGYIWVSTNRGLSRINPQTREIKNFDITDGLQGYEFNGTASFFDGEYLYFGGFNGLNYFIPEEVEISEYIPPIAITSFKTHNKQKELLAPHQPINLSYQDNFFSVEFSVMDFTNPKRNHYAYKLEGLDEEWIYSGNRNFAAYTNLDGGTYRLHVKGANKYGTWNETGITLPINIASPPWQRPWAYMLYASALLLIIFFIIRYKSLTQARLLAEKLRRMTTSLGQTLNLETVQNQLANHLQLILPYQQIIVFIKENQIFRKGLNFSFHSNNVTLTPAEQQHILTHLGNTLHPILLNNADTFSKLHLDKQKFLGNSLLALPLITRNHIVGAVFLFNHKTQNTFREEQINIALTLCAQASTAIDNAQLFEETKQLAFYDPLTGLANRRLFKERLEQLLRTIRRNNHGLTVMLLDLDQFKRINDSLGHDIGDTFLKEAAQRLSACVREQDTVARIGGDEFTILLSDIDGYKAATTVAQKILHAFSSPIKAHDYSINLSTSIGISLAPKDSMDANTLIKNADVALYKAKENGRNNYQFFTEEMNIHASAHLRLENELRYAIAHNEFELYYQPIINLHNNQIAGAEALLRWNHPRKGLLAPAQFIATAEETGLIKLIGAWVLHEAVSFTRRLQMETSQAIRISVNLSPKQIMHGGLSDHIDTLLKTLQVDARHLGLEVMENHLMENSREVIKELRQLKQSGITLAIDDFGTGYSSLSYLKQLPIDILKIDRSFIEGAPHDAEDIEITAAIIAMAHKLHLKVVAEGVETQEQLNFLQRNLCDYVQGFYLNRPMTATALLNLLKRSALKNA